MSDITVQQVMNAVEALAPTHYAEDWDNPGLMVGSRSDKVTGVLTTLDITPEALAEAKKLGYNMIVSHHPVIFKGLKRIDFDTAQGALLRQAILDGITLYSAHTNLDIAAGGLNDLAAAKIGLANVKGLVKTGSDTYAKIVTFVPVSHLAVVAEAITQAGAVKIGQYESCSFNTSGTGRFKPLDGAQPYIGEAGTLTETDEERLEVLIPTKRIGAVIDALKSSHPYEEPAFNVYPLTEPAQKQYIGRIGTFADAIDFELFKHTVQAAFPYSHPRFGGVPREMIRTVALCTGGGAEFLGDAAAAGADVYVTGDVKYHDAQRAKELGILIVDAGHFGTEEGAAPLLAAQIKQYGRKNGFEELPITPFMKQTDFFFA